MLLNLLKIFIWPHWVLVAACEPLKLQHAVSLVVMCNPLVVARGIWFPGQGSNLGSLHWEHGGLAAGPQGKSLCYCILSLSIDE